MCELRAGEYIAPERIEGALKKAPLVQQIFVHGNPFESALVAVVVPNPDELRRAWPTRAAPHCFCCLRRPPCATQTCRRGVPATKSQFYSCMLLGHAAAELHMP